MCGGQSDKAGVHRTVRVECVVDRVIKQGVPRAVHVECVVDRMIKQGVHRAVRVECAVDRVIKQGAPRVVHVECAVNRVVIGMGFPIVSVFSCQYHSISAPYASFIYRGQYIILIHH